MPVVMGLRTFKYVGAVNRSQCTTWQVRASLAPVCKVHACNLFTPQFRSLAVLMHISASAHVKLFTCGSVIDYNTLPMLHHIQGIPKHMLIAMRELNNMCACSTCTQCALEIRLRLLTAFSIARPQHLRAKGVLESVAAISKGHPALRQPAPSTGPGLTPPVVALVCFLFPGIWHCLVIKRALHARARVKRHAHTHTPRAACLALACSLVLVHAHARIHT